MKPGDESSHFKFAAAGFSDVGQRKNNEDAYLINKEIGLFIVADGMGGHAKGEVASWFSAENLDSYAKQVLNPKHAVTLDDPVPFFKGMTHEDVFEYAVFSINSRIFQENEERIAKIARELKMPEIAAEIARRQKMGTTLVSLFFHANKAYITNIGDSRAYRISGDSIALLTRDHSWVEEQIRAGKLSPAEARVHKKKNVITRSIGFKENVEADIDIVTVHSGEKFLLCSDGLSNVLEERALLEIASSGPVDAACQAMVEAALDRGGRDNVTAVLVEVMTSIDAQKLPSRHHIIDNTDD